MPSLSTKPVPREQRFYLALWRKAWLEPNQLLSFNCSSVNMAIAMRQGMYRAIRPYRSGDQIDEELRQAADKYVVYLLPENKADKSAPCKIEMRERKALAELEELGQLLGIDEEDLLIGEERAVAASLKDLINTSTKGQVNTDKVTKTKFYEREKD